MKMKGNGSSYPMGKRKGQYAGNKQEAGGKWPGHRMDFINSTQNRKGGNHPKGYM